MEYNKNSKFVDAFYACQAYPYLAQQLQFFIFYKKLIPDKNTVQYIYVQEMIGITELKMALAQAIITKTIQMET